MENLEAQNNEGKAAGGAGAPGLPAASPSLSISHNCTGKKENLLCGSHKKSAQVLRLEVEGLARRFTIYRLAFTTLTFARIRNVKEAFKRFHSLQTHVLKQRYPVGLRVLQRGEKNGRLHFHTVSVVPVDIRTGFDFQAVKNRDYRSVCPYLLQEWAFWRETAPKYGFGRVEMHPIRTNAEMIAKYVGGYIGKHIAERDVEDLGVRLVGYWGYKPGDRVASPGFAYNSPAAAIWRYKLEKWARSEGLDDYSDIRLKFGKRWAHNCYNDIVTQSIEGMPYETSWSIPPEVMLKNDSIVAEAGSRIAVVQAQELEVLQNQWARLEQREIDKINAKKAKQHALLMEVINEFDNERRKVNE